MAAGVDLSFVPRLTARFYSQTGQPGIDPVVLFKMALLGWLYGTPARHSSIVGLRAVGGAAAAERDRSAERWGC